MEQQIEVELMTRIIEKSKQISTYKMLESDLEGMVSIHKKSFILTNILLAVLSGGSFIASIVSFQNESSFHYTLSWLFISSISSIVLCFYLTVQNKWYKRWNNMTIWGKWANKLSKNLKNRKRDLVRIKKDLTIQCSFAKNEQEEIHMLFENSVKSVRDKSVQAEFAQYVKENNLLRAIYVAGRYFDNKVV